MPKASRSELRTIRCFQDISASIANLAAGAAAAQTLLTLARGFTVVKAIAIGVIRHSDADEAVLEVGLKDSELTNALCEALIELDGPDEPSQIAEVEISERARHYLRLGLVPSRAVAYNAAGDLVCPIELETSRALFIPEGHSIAMAFYNYGEHAVGANVYGLVRVELIGRWAP